MDFLVSWGKVLMESFSNVWQSFVAILPSLVGAVIVFVLGLFVARGLGNLVARALKKLYLDQAVDKAGLKNVLNKVGFTFEVSQALGLLVQWFLYIVALIAAADILGLRQISSFLEQVVLYVPNVIVAVVILIVGLIVSSFIHLLVKETATSAKLNSVDFLASVARWAILIFTFMAALVQLRVAPELIQILFTGLVLMISLAGGIAFGLGGKDRAKQLIDKIGR